MPQAMTRFRDKALPYVQTWRGRLREHRKRNPYHWVTVWALIFIGLYAGHRLEETPLPLRLRYWVYNLIERPPQKDSFSDDLVVVMIGDEEYWKRDGASQPLARRSPLNRYYLAELIDNMTTAHPRLLALDVDLRAQTPTRFAFDDPIYHDENQCLAESMRAAQETIGCRVVIPRAITRNYDDTYVHEHDAFDVYEPSYVSRGYIFGHFDVRRIPLPFSDSTGMQIDSFAFAILRELRYTALDDALSNARGDFLYSDFHHPKFFRIVPAGAIIRKDREALQQLQGKIVMVGGNWHNQAFDRGSLIDMHASPAGEIPGVLIHANWVQAMIRKQTFGALQPAIEKLVDIGLSLLAALIFVVVVPNRRLLAIVGLNIAAVIAVLLMWRFKGIYFDFVLPMMLLGGHVAFEQISEWKEDATEHQRVCLHMPETQP